MVSNKLEEIIYLYKDNDGILITQQSLHIHPDSRVKTHNDSTNITLPYHNQDSRILATPHHIIIGLVWDIIFSDGEYCMVDIVIRLCVIVHMDDRFEERKEDLEIKK